MNQFLIKLIIILLILFVPIVCVKADTIFKEGLPDFNQFQEGWSDQMCGPTSVANSFYWLSVKYNLPGLLSKKDGKAYTNDKEMIEDLAEAMIGNRNFQEFPGVTIEQMLDGKRKFAKERNIDLIIYPPTQWDAVVVWDGPSRKIQSLSQGPNIEWLKEQVKKCEDVELFIALVSKSDLNWYVDEGHIVSLAGYEDQKIIINDPDTKKIGKTQPKEDQITKKKHTFFGKEYETISERWELEEVEVKGIKLYALKGYGSAPDTYWVITGGLAESPVSVPEPATIILGGIGLAIISTFIKNRFKI